MLGPTNAVSPLTQHAGGLSYCLPGAALSFVDPETQAEALAKVQASQPVNEQGAAQPSELPFNIKEVYSFKYRVDSVKRSITRIAVREARLAELKQEVRAAVRWRRVCGTTVCGRNDEPLTGTVLDLVVCWTLRHR